MNDTFFDVSIIAFGTHLSEKHGSTVKNIESDGFNVKKKSADYAFERFTL